MTTSLVSVLQLYQSTLSRAWLDDAARERGLHLSGRIYTVMVVLWLMIRQRLEAGGTLAQAVGGAIGGQCGSLLPKSRRRALSSRTGGYCRARQRMSLTIMSAAVHHLTATLQQRLTDARRGPPLYLLDGSSLRLAHEEELLAAYPATRNQHGRSHWPVLKIVVLHDARTGLAAKSAWGPMFGPQAVSEQALARQCLPALPVAAVVLGDCNFGIFAMAWEVSQAGHQLIFRLTKARARALGGHSLPAGERAMVWQPSRWDRRSHPHLPPDACLAGRLLVFPLPGLREPLYLFTTVQAPAQEILQWYGLRWNVETDLRSLKQTVRLEHITVKSKQMLEKELWAALAAYNLVRTVMALAARQAGHDPRELSFSHVLYLVKAFLPSLLDDSDSPKFKEELRSLLRATAQCKLPKRRKRRSYPRQVWGRGYQYPQRHEAPTLESK